MNISHIVRLKSMQIEFSFTESTVIVEQEAWKPCNGFEDYEVSSFGRFRNIKTGRFLSGTMHYCGYRNIGLNKNGKIFTKLAHRLVAEAFVERTDSTHSQVNHKNKDRTDNRASNLEWLTPSKNMIHSWRGRRKK